MMHASTPSTSRRSLLAGLAAIGAAAPAVAVAMPANDDAELSAAFAEFQRVSAAWDAAHERQADTEEVYYDIAPAFPEAAIKTEADHEMFLCVNVGQKYAERDLSRLRKPQSDFITGKPCAAKTARAHEIVKALEDFYAADAAARLMSGFAEAEQRAEEAEAALDDVTARLLAIPAKTMAGVIMKARVVEWCYGGIDSLPAPEDYSKSTAETFVMAVAVDLIRITKGQADG